MKFEWIVVAALSVSSTGVLAKGGSSGHSSSHSTSSTHSTSSSHSTHSGDSSSNGSSSSSHEIKGYVKKNGTYVAPSHATNPDNKTSNNYTHTGNVNPYSGRVGTKND